MRTPMYSNHFTILTQSDGECNIRFFTLRAEQDSSGNMQTIDNETKGLRAAKEGEHVAISTVDEQTVFMTIDHLTNLQKEIGKVIAGALSKTKSAERDDGKSGTEGGDARD